MSSTPLAGRDTNAPPAPAPDKLEEESLEPIAKEKGAEHIEPSDDIATLVQTETTNEGALISQPAGFVGDLLDKFQGGDDLDLATAYHRLKGMRNLVLASAEGQNREQEKWKEAMAMIKKSVKLSEIAHSRGQQYNKIGNRAFAEVSALVAFLKTAEAAGAHAAQAATALAEAEADVEGKSAALAEAAAEVVQMQRRAKFEAAKRAKAEEAMAAVAAAMAEVYDPATEYE